MRNRRYEHVTVQSDGYDTNGMQRFSIIVSDPNCGFSENYCTLERVLQILGDTSYHHDERPNHYELSEHSYIDGAITDKCSCCNNTKLIIFSYNYIKFERKICKDCLAKAFDKLFEINSAEMERVLFGEK